MRSHLGVLALAPIALLLQGCPAPPYGHITITNNSGQRIAFESCRREKFSLAPGETAKLTNEYAVTPRRQWACYRERPLVVTTESGEDWSYTLWIHRDFVTKPRKRPFAEFEEPARPSQSYGTARRSWVSIEIRPDGSIGAGEYDGPTYLGRKGVPRFPLDPQPTGFPIEPKRSRHAGR